MKKLLAPLIAAAIAATFFTTFVGAFHAGVAHAQTAGSSVGSGSGSSVTAAPADKLHDPLAAPEATFDDIKALKKVGWGVAVLAVLIIATRLLGKLGGSLKVLSTGKASLAIAAVGAFALTAFNAISLGGSWAASLTTAIVAGFGAWDAAAKPKEDPPK